jgi:hypothetical protein
MHFECRLELIAGRKRAVKSNPDDDFQDPLTPALSPPYPLADMAILSGKHAKACLLGEGEGCGPSSGVERNSGVLSPAISACGYGIFESGRLAKASLRGRETE